MMGLRERLLASYLLLLAITIGVFLFAAIYILNTRPAPPQPTWRQLAALALSADLDQIMRTSRPGSLIQSLDDVFDRLDQLAQDSDVRILVYSEPRRVVLFDSADSLEAGTTLNGTIEDYPITQRFMRNIIVPIASGIAGSFVDKGQEWLFFGLSRLRSLGGGSY